jgi:hypothetical protein
VDRRAFLAGSVAFLAAPLAAESQQAGKVYRIGCYERSLALAEPRGMRPLVAHCHLGLGKLYRCIDKREPAQEHLTTVTSMYREMDMRFWREQAEAAIAEVG